MRLLLSLGLWLLVVSASRAETFVYLSLASERKIAVYKMDPTDGKLTHSLDVLTEGEPGALVTDPAKKFLFASLRAQGKLSAFQLDPRTGKLTHQNTVEAGPDPAHLSTDKEGRFLLCAYYVAAKVTVHAIQADGSLSGQPVQTIATADKAHAILLDRTNRFAFVPHTGPNAIFQFSFNALTGQLQPGLPAKLLTPENSGPRHIVFHPKENVAYIDNEQGGSVTAFRLDPSSGSLAPAHTVATLPKDYKGPNACAEIKIHPTGRFLYVSNRGHDSLARLQIGEDPTRLTVLGQTPTEKTPRSFDLDPDGRFLLAAGEASGKLATYRIDAVTGDLTRLAISDVGKTPWWVLMVRTPTR